MRTDLFGAEATLAFAAEWAARLQAGDTVGLVGELGAGKTTFVRGVLQALGVERWIKSPTFNLVQVFETTPPVLHADLYRLGAGGFDEMNDYLGTHICLVEWPDRMPELPYTHVFKFDFIEGGRTVEVTLLEQGAVGL
ncbi:MAG: tRNA (adenosine(37)-N6)-threonylcarbamoyltransferase complex ATPase subunit type 1 TsaE [Chthonomonas sp.]|nr:tRNA (adenosine(37)-N6)-threonylcarbamoyltransferase complex ATPase subunit type 1 TsaE [Chthonomonas sp.]